MEVKFKPSPGLILVKPIEKIKPKETRGKANIIIPGQEKASSFAEVEEIYEEWPFQADVVAVGEPLPSIPMDYNVGDRVYLVREASTKDAVLINKSLYAYLRVSDIIGRVI